MPNVMVALPNIGGALCSTPQSLADAHSISNSLVPGHILHTGATVHLWRATVHP